jgi:hypothetical protein
VCDWLEESNCRTTTRCSLDGQQGAVVTGKPRDGAKCGKSERREYYIAAPAKSSYAGVEKMRAFS